MAQHFLSGSYRERIAAEMAASIATAENNLKLANKECNDADYDLPVLKNRCKSIMDEIYYYGVWGLFIAHFVP